MYYTYTIYCISLFYFTIQWHGYYTEFIRCTESGAGDAIAPAHVMNYCLSYSRNSKTHQSILFYKWVPWTLILCILYFYFVKKIVKFFNKIKNSSGKPFCKYVCVHILALIMNILAFFFIDFCLQGVFKDLVPSTYPFNRDFKNFSDELTNRFYPFATCIIHENTIFGLNSEYKCHLIYMEYYEKFLIIFWLWLCIIALINFFYIIFILIKYVCCKFERGKMLKSSPFVTTSV